MAKRSISPTVLLATGIWLLLLVTNPGRNETVDVGMRVLVARQMWSSLSVTLPYHPDQSRDAWVATPNGRWAAPYGVGQSILFAPFDALGVTLARAAPPALQEYVSWLPIGLVLLPSLGALWWWVSFRLLLEWGLSRRWSLAGASAAHLGTIIFHYSGQGQEETLVGLLISCTLLFVFRVRKHGRYRDAILAGLFAGSCLVTRPVAIFALAVVPCAALGFRGTWQRAVRLAATAGAVTLLVASGGLYFNFARFGTPFSVGYDRLGHFAKLSWDQRSLDVLFSLLGGPGIGLFVLSPVLLLALFAQPSLWRADRGYALGCWLAVGSCLLFFSAWHDSYTGGGAWGTRYQCHLLSLFVLPVTIGLRAAWRARRARYLVPGLVVVSGLIQIASVTATHHLEVYQDTCDRVSASEFRTGLRRGQLGRRLENLARWTTGLPAVVENPSPGCRESVDKMWQRYIPNFWGPVFAKRLGVSGYLVFTVWTALAVAALAVLGRGLAKVALK